MGDQPRAGLARIQVAATLRRMREQAGVARDRAAAELSCTVSKIGDLETGRSRPKPAELEKLLDLYDVTGPDRDELVETAREARRRRRTGTANIPPGDQRFLDLESQARKITFCSPELIPGFVQTDGYARALFEWRSGLSADAVERRIALRAARRALLARADPPRCWCILGEAALRANVGGPAVMAEQLHALLQATKDVPNFVIQILPTGSGAHGAIGVTRTLMEFDPPAGPVLHVDTDVRNVFFDDAVEMATVGHDLDLIRAQALDRERSAALIELVIRGYEAAISDGGAERVVHLQPNTELRQLRRGLPGDGPRSRP